jgi:hypothetical protein
LEIIQIMAHSPDDACPKISAERWRRIDSLLDAALEREASERAAFLKKVCAGDEELYAEVESLLACEGQEHPLLASVAWPAAGLVARERTLAGGGDTQSVNGRPIVGLQVDRFRITGCLGRGGMGEVYSAEDPTLSRNVALKFLTPEAAPGGAVEQVTREARAASILSPCLSVRAPKHCSLIPC